MYQSDWDAFTSCVSTVLVSTHRFKNDEAHSCWVAGKVYQRCQCRVHKFSLNAGRIFFFSISFFSFFATTRSHNKPYPDEWHVPALGRPNKVVSALPQKRRSWFTELPNTSSCCWLERKVNRQGIFFRTPYPLVQSHFRIKPLCVTGVPNLLKYIIMTLRYVTLCCDIVIRDYMWCKTVKERHGSWSISIKYNHFL